MRRFERLRERVCAAFAAARWRLGEPRLRALAFAKREIAAVEADAEPSRRSARSEELARSREDLDEDLLFEEREDEDFLPGGGGRSTPARRALESPMAIACLVDRAL